MRRHAASRCDLLVTSLALACLLAWDASGWDLALTHWYGTAAGFGWRDAWLTRSLLHDGGRLFAWGALGLLVVDACHPLLPGPKRIERWHWIGVMLAGVLLVPSIKRVTTTSCPWDLAEFGGVASYVSHWQIGVSDGGPGHCFPSGHAVAAFSFFGIYFLWREHRPRLAGCFLAIVLLAGSVFGALGSMAMLDTVRARSAGKRPRIPSASCQPSTSRSPRAARLPRPHPRLLDSSAVSRKPSGTLEHRRCFLLAKLEVTLLVAAVLE